MATSHWVASAGTGTSVSHNTTRYFGPCGAAIPNDTETRAEAVVREAGATSNFQVSVVTNILTTASAVFTLRKNNADATQTVTFAAAETGTKADASNSDSFSAGDTMAVSCVIPADGGSGVCAPRTLSVVYVPTDTTKSVLPLVAQAVSTLGASVSTASATRFNDCATQIYSAFGIANTEAAETLRIQSACTTSRLRVVVTANTRTTNTIFSTRKNAADGTQSVTFGNVETGTKEDASNSDTLAVGDDYCYSITSSTGAGTLVMRTIQTWYSATTRMFPWYLGISGNQLYDTSGGNFFEGASGGLLGSVTSTEVGTQFTVRSTGFVLKKLTVNVRTSTYAGGGATFSTRRNTAAGAQSVSYGAAETGLKEDTTNTDTVVATDVVSNLVNVTATSGLMGVGSIAVWGEVAASTRRFILGRH